MHDFEVMKGLKTESDLYEYFPNVYLLEGVPFFLMVYYLLVEIPIVRVFHHYTKIFM